eukprot:Colp12_sorted_trinity150504_noHs@3473
MVVAIRLARFGVAHKPFYKIRVANKRGPRDGKYIEEVGSYNPLPDHHNVKQVVMNVHRIKYWLSVGAQPTDAVAKLLAQSGVLPPHPRTMAGFINKRRVLAEAVENGYDTQNIEFFRSKKPKAKEAAKDGEKKQ